MSLNRTNQGYITLLKKRHLNQSVVKEFLSTHYFLSNKDMRLISIQTLFISLIWSCTHKCPNGFRVYKSHQQELCWTNQAIRILPFSYQIYISISLIVIVNHLKLLYRGKERYVKRTYSVANCLVTKHLSRKSLVIFKERYAVLATSIALL